MDWFEELTGFREGDYHLTRSRLEISRGQLRSKVNGRTFATGELETPTLAELRQRGQEARRELAGTLQVSCVSGDARTLHHDPASEHALFQVASQFNLLEMVGPGVTPEDGVAGYAHDPTQGPACAIAAGAATIYRNYFADVDGASGQTKQRQIDCLRDVGRELGNAGESLWAMRNGYALCAAEGLRKINCRLSASNAAELDDLRGLLRIGLHWDVEVTDAPEPAPVVSQAFCSALPVGYSEIPSPQWTAFAALVLDGAYEATLWAAALNARRARSNVLYLTRLGGGAFGNDPTSILGALRRSLEMFRDVALDIRIVSRHEPPVDLLQLAKEYRP